ncbi:MAG: hypothetical protein ABIC68_08210 [Candidatus Omnitrophota bacterium]
MLKFFLQLCIFVILISSAYAASVQDYADSAYECIYQRNFTEAIKVLNDGLKEYPGDIRLIFALGEAQHNDGDYNGAIHCYLSVFKALKHNSAPIPKDLNKDLTNAYNSLGEQHLFTQDLLLRIIYHAEQFLEADRMAAIDPSYLGFLKKSIGSYDNATLGVTVMVRQGDGKAFILQEDIVSIEEKMDSLEKARRRVNL